MKEVVINTRAANEQLRRDNRTLYEALGRLRFALRTIRDSGELSPARQQLVVDALAEQLP